MSHNYEGDQGKPLGIWPKWIFMAFVVIAAYFLVTEHRAHLSGLLYYLPFLLLLACPLMHIFMHGGHGKHGRHHGDGAAKERKPS